jgi:hypothetical protein
MKYSLQGDLCQMFTQKKAMDLYEVPYIMQDVYPTIEGEKDYKRALVIIWDDRIEGWWHYKEDYVRYGICSAEEFDTRLHKQVESKKTV